MPTLRHVVRLPGSVLARASERAEVARWIRRSTRGELATTTYRSAPEGRACVDFVVPSDKQSAHPLGTLLKRRQPFGQELPQGWASRQNKHGPFHRTDIRSTMARPERPARAAERSRHPGIQAWFAMALSKDYTRARELALEAIRNNRRDRFALTTLAEIHAKEADWEAAEARCIDALRSHPKIPWYWIRLADLLVEAKQLRRASRVLERAVSYPLLRRHAAKRLARIHCELGDFPTALRWQLELVALAPNYFVYASDYVLAAALLILTEGNEVKAERVLGKGRSIYSRNRRLLAGLEALRAGTFDAAKVISRAMPSTASDGTEARDPASGETVVEIRGNRVSRIPIGGPLITMHTDLLSVLDTGVSAFAESGDIVAVSESVLSISQGRAIPLEIVDAGPIARVLCRFVTKEGPLHSPEGMQGAVAEAGCLRVLSAAGASGVGKALGVRGVFYRIAGRNTAMIDDVAACMPPHDHHLILAPAVPELFCELASRILGLRVCVVDANSKTGAWVVASSPGVDVRAVEKALVDNPAGNEDEQTPIVLVRGLP